MLHKNAVLDDRKAGTAPSVTARKVFCTFPTAVFIDNYEIEFDILNRVSTYTKVPINCVLVAGSAQTGESFVKKTPFVQGRSDLDLAIVNLDLYSRLLEISNRVTKGFRDMSKFERRGGENPVPTFLENLGRGFFRPDLMPACDEKTAWFNFFRSVSNDYRKDFSTINAGVYASLGLFEYQRVNDVGAV